WSVAAQVNGSHARVQFTKMPWQLDEEFKNTPFSREEHPFAWEIGRGAQNEAKSIDTLIANAVLGMAHEMMVYGADFKDGYVFANSLGREQSRLFKMRKTPRTGEPLLKVYAAHGDDHSNEVLMGRLTDFLEFYPPQNISVQINDV